MSLLACFVGSCLLGCWRHLPCPNSAAGGYKHEGLHRITGRQGLFEKKKKIPCRNSAMGKIFVSTSSCWCHIARDKRSLQRNQRMEMGFEVALPRTNLWCCWHHCLEDGQLVLFLPAPCRDKCTILHQIRSW